MNGKDWIAIGTLNGAKNSKQVLNYQLFDYNPAHGIRYYRLKQTDINAEMSYSSVVKVNYIDALNPQIKLYPQPVASNLTIDVPNNESENASVTVFNAMGEKLISLENLSGLQFNIDLSELLNGVYYIEVNIDGVISKSKVLKH